MSGNRVVKLWDRISAETMMMAAVLVFACGGLLGAGFDVAHAQQSPPSKAEVAPPTPVAVDAPFLETLADYQMILREVERLEGATGTVEIPVSISQLRERANGKMGKIRGWMKEHKVGDDWKYDAERRSFTPPGPVAAGTEAKRP